MRRRVATPVLFGAAFCLVAALPGTAHATQVAVEFRHTPMLVRPNDTPSLCGMLALSLGEHWWAGAGYELVQDYDAVLWTGQDVGRKPIVMSGLRAGGWYRGDAFRGGMSFSLGGLFTVANRSFSIETSRDLDNGTYVVDFGLDLTLGHAWKGFRLEAFATPAWSYGRIVSPAVDRDDRYSAFTYRVGGVLAILIGP